MLDTQTLVMETTDENKALAMERSLPTGNYTVKVFLLNPLSQEGLNSLQDRLLDGGVQLTDPIEMTCETPSAITIRAYKPPIGKGIGLAWSPLIPVVAIVAGAFAFAVWKAADIISAMSKLALIVFGGLILYALASKRRAL